MNLDTLRQYCLSKSSTSEDFPFDDQTLVMRVHGKIFALIALDASPLSVNLKCAPEKALELREQYPCVQPGFHMNKRHWNTVLVDGSVSPRLIEAWVDHSYDLVWNGLPKRLRGG
ncbi:MAG: MmcQ/YjbR family DNA-binding protein [Myxococcota bacterium]|jgi:predicted DNA-binding protein (MmcQ/YjbR family)|nr:MmcQ/YjbR family DNA-binding protein [Myxococcota bacterium]